MERVRRGRQQDEPRKCLRQERFGRRHWLMRDRLSWLACFRDTSLDLPGATRIDLAQGLNRRCGVSTAFVALHGSCPTRPGPNETKESPPYETEHWKSGQDWPNCCGPASAGICSSARFSGHRMELGRMDRRRAPFDRFRPLLSGLRPYRYQDRQLTPSISTSRASGHSYRRYFDDGLTVSRAAAKGSMRPTRQLRDCVWPSTTSSCPVTLPARSLAANSTMFAISLAVTMRPSAAW